MGQLNIIVSDRATIEAGILVRSSYVLISIHDPYKPRPRVPKQSGLRDVLYLAFHDAEPSVSLALPDGVRLMTALHAEQIVRFVEKHRGQVGAVVVHCEQGMSRSPAVAVGIALLIGQPAERFLNRYQPNQHVLDRMRDALRSLRAS